MLIPILNITINLTSIAIFLVGFLIALTILGIIVAMLPTGNVPSETLNTIAWITEVLVDFDFIFPVEEMLRVVSYIVIIEAVLIGIKATLWVLRTLKGTTPPISKGGGLEKYPLYK